nr:unnamed protein product [Digitaria exilis]
MSSSSSRSRPPSTSISPNSGETTPEQDGGRSTLPQLRRGVGCRREFSCCVHATTPAMEDEWEREEERPVRGGL